MALLELANELLLSITEALGSETDINVTVVTRAAFSFLNHIYTDIMSNKIEV